MDQKEVNRHRSFIIISIILIIGIFFADTISPLGIAGGIPYVAVVLLTLWIPKKNYTIILGVICSLLVVVGFYLSPLQDSLPIVVTNRLLAMFGIWAAVFVILLFKRSQETAIKNNERLDALFKYATEGIIITDKSGKIVMCNPKSEEQFGYKSGEMVDKKIEELVPQRFHNKHVHHRDDYYAHPHPRSMGKNMELYAMRKDHSEFPVEISLSYFYTEEGVFVISFIIDITERREQQQLLKEAHEELKQFAQELMYSNQELEQFAYVASHDLQEPLRKIQAFGGRIASMDDNHLNEKSEDYLKRMLNAASRMQKLINDLLTFSRVTSKAQPFEEVDLNVILDGVLSDLEITIENTGAKIEIPTSLPVVYADPTQMRQLFQNLISNAIKFRKDEEAPVVNIIYHPEMNAPEEKLAHLDIQDNGIGFDQKYQDKIFTIFQRLEGQRYEGSGIGLAICKKIVNRHNGEITVKSELGKGTTFSFSLSTKIIKTKNNK